MNKDVLFTIYEILHRDLTKQLIAEYHKKLGRCCVNSTICNNVCQCHISINHYACFYVKAYNYRILKYEWSYVYTKNNQYGCDVSKNY